MPFGKSPHCLQMQSQHTCEHQNKLFVINISYIMDRDLDSICSMGLSLSRIFWNQSHKSLFLLASRGNISLQQNPMSSDTFYDPAVCSHRTAEGSTDKLWCWLDSSAVNHEVAFAGKLLPVHRSLKLSWKQQLDLGAGMKTLLSPPILRQVLFFFCQGFKCLLLEAESQRDRPGFWGHRGLICWLHLQTGTFGKHEASES